jgi:hypothetical protein
MRHELGPRQSGNRGRQGKIAGHVCMFEASICGVMLTTLSLLALRFGRSLAVVWVKKDLYAVLCFWNREVIGKPKGLPV